jgi:CPA1 family monovalent cation:H+ antiporter
LFSILDSAAILLVLSAVFGWTNHRYFGLPRTTGLLLTGLVVSLGLVGLDLAFPNTHLHTALTERLLQVDFSDVVMNGMLAFLLFAGALDVDFGALRSRAWPIAFLAIVGTTLSTVIVGSAFWGAAQLAGTPIPLAWALVFGALISPTDPVAVLSTLKSVQLPKALEAELQGEALFNDGVGVVLFTVLLGLAVGSSAHGTDAQGLAHLLLREVLGGLTLGLAAGYLAFLAMRAIDDFAVEVLITLALVTGTYALAQQLGTSGPLAVVAAGLLIGDRGPRLAMSDRTQRYVSTLWTLIDEVLNSVLFLLIGLEVIILRFRAIDPLQAALAIPIVLAARLMALGTPILAFPKTLSATNLPFLTWAGVRGGISVALALSLPDNPAKPMILAATYAVVLFSILIQGSTLGWLARRTIAKPA